jgi:hypothetical protein
VGACDNKKNLAPGVLSPSNASGQVLLRHLTKFPNRLHGPGPNTPPATGGEPLVRTPRESREDGF